MADSDNESGGHNAGGGDLSQREQDRFLPIANVSRIMKKALPANAKISKDAKETVQECVSEFISFVTGEASDKCQREKRKTINGDDLLWAMTTLGFEEYVEPLKVYLGKYREMEGERTAVGGGGGGGGGGRQGERDGGGGSGGGGGGFNGGMVYGGMQGGGMVMMGQQHQGQVYGSGYPMGIGDGGGGKGNNVGGGGSNMRPR
ncbi:nuclear transcription factor Y subunit B-3-like [Rhododendron vialii]|uniref:nuclear transcription factor Y subunit B-3-like n=1 Tax=Rhododendron vialii TaxID=182163 RepID=UPI00265EF0E7|nr:nuclear transcription factor Y subunit B-3-like [Rhododendron vialii]